MATDFCEAHPQVLCRWFLKLHLCQSTLIHLFMVKNPFCVSSVVVSWCVEACWCALERWWSKSSMYWCCDPREVSLDVVIFALAKKKILVTALFLKIWTWSLVFLIEVFCRIKLGLLSIGDFQLLASTIFVLPIFIHRREIDTIPLLLFQVLMHWFWVMCIATILCMH